jgi:hypothetical protein
MGSGLKSKPLHKHLGVVAFWQVISPLFAGSNPAVYEYIVSLELQWKNNNIGLMDKFYGVLNPLRRSSLLAVPLIIEKPSNKNKSIVLKIVN